MLSANNEQIEELKRIIEEEREARNKKQRDRKQHAVAYTKKWEEKNKEHRRAYSRERYRKLKEEMVALKGGKCADCGGVFPPYAYDFHHVAGKDTKITVLIMLGRTKLLEELNRCVLLCAICHRGRHVVEGRDAEC